jgi:hypothetical protein
VSYAPLVWPSLTATRKTCMLRVWIQSKLTISASCALVPQYHQYQIVGRHSPTDAEPEPQVYRMKLWSLNDTKAKSKFWCVFTGEEKMKTGMRFPGTGDGDRTTEWNGDAGVPGGRGVAAEMRGLFRRATRSEARRWRRGRFGCASTGQHGISRKTAGTQRQALTKYFPHTGSCCRYFLSRLKKVKKANGQIVACNEVRVPTRQPARRLVAGRMQQGWVLCVCACNAPWRQKNQM